MIVDNITIPTGLKIGGEWRHQGRATIPVYNPADESQLTTIASADAQDAQDAIEAASRGFSTWRKTSPRHRSEVLRRAFHLMQERKETIARIITLEEGKTLNEARGEVNYASEFFRWFADQSVQMNDALSTAPNGDKAIMVTHQPVGIAYLVTPWNFPAAMATRKIAPALAAGCSVILKPATETPLTALYVAELLTEAGVPDDVISVLPSLSARTISEVMFADDRVRKVSFTGSTEVGRVLLHNAAERVVNSSMELGGNAPLLVLDDADFDTAVEQTLVAKIRNAGESCIAANRIYVARQHYDAFSDALASKMAALKMGDGTLEGVDIGPMVNRTTQQKVASLVDDAVQKGAKLLTGGVLPDGAGYFYPPTVLKDLTDNADILHTEIFGPVAVIIPFDDEQAAIAAANNTIFGLAAYVMSSDAIHAVSVAKQLEAGVVGINKGVISDPAAPFGGMKQSGLGREGGYVGIAEFTETQYIGLDWPSDSQ
ncbi:NAD-dependent succinate-semialdehyde dehydrogenase [Enterovibrio calviensis]|uniref:NAD-dependent succinate-semialdehyde dehydrogenase n=1 Tax=Enterovibrio calviensis TaxID=91359 RepID=UPI00047FC736|nr:NAD-dependent succinate-semialdehyde dehydrogenase [Enterovibrio calviensis]